MPASTRTCSVTFSGPLGRPPWPLAGPRFLVMGGFMLVFLWGRLVNGWSGSVAARYDFDLPTSDGITYAAPYLC